MSLRVAEPVDAAPDATTAECRCRQRIWRRSVPGRWLHENGAITCGTGAIPDFEVGRPGRHPYADHPAAAVLADHIAAVGVRAATSRAVCDCGWRGAVCDYPAHLAEVLDQAVLLAPSAVTVEEAAEGDPGMEATQAWFRNGGC